MSEEQVLVLPPWPGKHGDPEKLKEWNRVYKRIKQGEDPEHNRAVRAAYREKNPGKHAAAVKRYISRVWQEVLDHYGRTCQCCGEADERFLTLDHTNNDGAEHRREVGSSGQAVWRDLRKRGWPPGFQTLCFNCNLGKQRNGGVCPHQEEIENDSAVA